MPHADRPYVLASVAMSLDGFIDDGSSERLVLSNEQDLYARDEIRANHDAILVGAATVRRDNPALLIDSKDLRMKREAAGHSPDLIKVTLTKSGNLDVQSKFFQTGSAAKFVYCPDALVASLQKKLGKNAEVIGLSDPAPLHVLRDLARRNVRRLMIEGGEKIHTAFLQDNMVDELRIAIAPFFVGAAQAARFVGAGRFPFMTNRPMKLTGVERAGGMAILNYRLA